MKELQDITKAGKANEYFSIGDVVGPIMLNGTVGDVTLKNYPAYFIIIGIDHLIEAEKPGYHTLTFQFGKSGLEDDAKFIALHGNFKPSTTKGGWAASKLKTYCSQFKSCLPTAWQEAIIPVTKYTDNVGQDSNYTGKLYEKVTTTTEEVFLPNIFEGGTRFINGAMDTYSPHFQATGTSSEFELVVSWSDDYYPYNLIRDSKGYNIFINNVYAHNNLDQLAEVILLRSPYVTTAYYEYWHTVLNTIFIKNFSSDLYIQPCFCIGGVATDSPSYSTDEYMLKSEFDTRINQFGGKLSFVYMRGGLRRVQYNFVDNSSNKYLIYNVVKQGYKLSEAEEFLNAAEIIYKYSIGELTETPGKIEPTLTVNTTDLSYGNSKLIITYNGDGILTIKDTRKVGFLYFEPVEGSPNSYRVNDDIIYDYYGTLIIHAYEGQQYASKTITIDVDTRDPSD